jgi:16S rRNA (uracil1498-N3)-methyltransferase
LISVVITQKNKKNNIIEIIDKKDIHHLKNVFRIAVGNKIRAVDGENEYLTIVLDISSVQILLQIEEIRMDQYSQKLQVHMGISLLKNDKMEFVIQKLTELGVHTIAPIMTKRVVVQFLDKEKERKKLEKWNRIMIETLKQCQGVKKTSILPVQQLQQLDFSIYDLILVPYEGENQKTLKTLLANSSTAPQKILVIIGPEGGFDPEEIQFLKEKFAQTVTLGKRILRAETAAIVVGGILFYAFT